MFSRWLYGLPACAPLTWQSSTLTRYWELISSANLFTAFENGQMRNMLQACCENNLFSTIKETGSIWGVEGNCFILLFDYPADPKIVSNLPFIGNIVVNNSLSVMICWWAFQHHDLGTIKYIMMHRLSR